MQAQSIKISLLQSNTGKIEGLPKNPRTLKDEKYLKLLQSLKDDPEMLELRELIVYPLDGKFIVIAGNMRLKAMTELKPQINNRIGLDYQDIWRVQRKMGRDEDHATKKPVEILNKPILHASKEDDIVLDLFGGSGSTMITSHQLRRRAYLQELDPKYCQVIIDRMLKLDPTLIIKKNGDAI